MSVDLSITNNSEWIAKREKLWPIVEDMISEGFTRKQIARYKKYFMTGERPAKNELATTSYVELFPLLTIDGIAYVCKNYLTSDIEFHHFRSISSAFMLRINTLVGLTNEERFALFNHIFGKSYDPERKFPFLIGDEIEYRPIPLSVVIQFQQIWAIFERWFLDENDTGLNTSRLIDYWFSLIPYIDPGLFLAKLPLKIKHGKETKEIQGFDLRIMNSLLRRSVFGSVLTPPKEVLNSSNSAEKIAFLNKIAMRFDALEGPAELKEFWELMKSEKG